MLTCIIACDGAEHANVGESMTSCESENLRSVCLYQSVHGAFPACPHHKARVSELLKASLRYRHGCFWAASGCCWCFSRPRNGVVDHRPCLTTPLMCGITGRFCPNGGSSIRAMGIEARGTTKTDRRLWVRPAGGVESVNSRELIRMMKHGVELPCAPFVCWPARSASGQPSAGPTAHLRITLVAAIVGNESATASHETIRKSPGGERDSTAPSRAGWREPLVGIGDSAQRNSHGTMRDPSERGHPALGWRAAPIP